MWAKLQEAAAPPLIICVQVSEIASLNLLSSCVNFVGRSSQAEGPDLEDILTYWCLFSEVSSSHGSGTTSLHALYVVRLQSTKCKLRLCHNNDPDLERHIARLWNPVVGRIKRQGESALLVRGFKHQEPPRAYQ